jgi:hypothetical protein
MNRHVNAISGRLSLHPPQRRSLVILDRITEIAPPKKAAGVQWCRHASAHAATFNGKPWRYILIPHDAIAENMTLEVLAGQFEVK